eukprot:COSAG01_NODE_22515_length_852_cov_1.183267_2_plen_132_part_00
MRQRHERTHREQAAKQAQPSPQHGWLAGWPTDTSRVRGRPIDVRVRVKIMGSQTCRNVGKSQSVLIMINPMISTRTRICTRYAGGAQGRWSRAYQRPQSAEDPLLLAGRARLLNERQDVLCTTRPAPTNQR